MAFLSTTEDVLNHFKNNVAEAEAKLIAAKANEFMAGLLLDYGVKPITVATFVLNSKIHSWHDFFRQRPNLLELPPEIWQIMESRFAEFKHGLYQ